MSLRWYESSLPRAPVGTAHCWDYYVPKGIASKETLMNRLARGLSLPSHFGHNWDALSDCFADLEWARAPWLRIAHEDLPLAGTPDEARMYLHLLWELSESDGDDVEHRVEVFFPESLRSEIETLLADADDEVEAAEPSD